MKLIKLLLSLVIIYFLLSYYNIFSIDKGFTKGTSDEDISTIAKLEEVKYLKIGDSYWIMYETDDEYFIENAEATEMEMEIVMGSFELAGVDVDEVNYIWAIVGLAAIIIIGFIPTRRKNN